MSTHEATGAIPELTLGWRIQMALDEGGYTNERMGHELDVHRTTIGHWCRDEGRPPRDLYLKEIARRCEVNYDWLRYGATAGTPPKDGMAGANMRSDQGITESGWIADTAGRVVQIRRAA